MKTLLILALVALAWPAFAQAPATKPETRIALKGGTLIDGYGGVPIRNSVILVQGERITAVGQEGTLAVTTPSAFGGTMGASLTLNGGTLSLGSGTLTSGGIQLESNSTIEVGDGANVTIDGTIDGSASLTKTGAGTLTLSGANSYQGTTTVAAGTLSVAADGNLGTGAVTLDGGTLQVTSFATSSTPIDNDIVLGSGGGTIRVESGSFFKHSGIISGSGSLTKTGGSSLVLAGNDANTFTGTVIIDAGYLLALKSGALGQGPEKRANGRGR